MSSGKRSSDDSSSTSTVMKKPASKKASPNSDSEDSAKKLSAEALEELSQEHIKQNDSLNGCMNAALKILNQKHMILMNNARDLAEADVSGFQGKMIVTLKEDVGKVITKLEETRTAVQLAFINKQNMLFMDDNVDILQQS